jgi:hypothetical protein
MGYWFGAAKARQVYTNHLKTGIGEGRLEVAPNGAVFAETM